VNQAPGAPRTVIIVQARMTSTRLPGKVLLEVLGKPLLEYLVERLRRVRLAQQIVVATTVNAADEPIVALCRRLGVAVWRGSEHDVLGRYHGAALAHRAEVVVRITSDCPLMDPRVVDGTIGYYLRQRGQLDYASNSLQRSFPRGLDTEVFAFKSLAEAYAEAVGQQEREHVTPFLYRHPQRYRLGNFACRQNLSAHRWTVDTPEDFELIRHIITALSPVLPQFGLWDAAAWLKGRPQLAALNAHVEQKTLTS
jgi:spore coat polysaccharide biosynthesis protein SpsF